MSGTRPHEGDTRNPRERRFAVAGVEALVTTHDPAGLPALAGSYDLFPPGGGPPDLVLHITRVDRYPVGKPHDDIYPGFHRTRIPGGGLALTRSDAEGELHVHGDVVRGQFRVGGSPNSTEAAIRAGLSVALPLKGALILHSSAVEHRGRAWVFAGVSGAGKSTVSNLLVGALPSATKLADDLLIATPDSSGRWHVHVPPFVGGANLPHGRTRPIQAIHTLVQAQHHARKMLSAQQATQQILRHVVAHVVDPHMADRVLWAAHNLCASQPVFELEFAPDAGVAQVLDVTC